MPVQSRRFNPSGLNLLELHTAVEQASVAVVITDVDGCIRYANPAFTAMTGYPVEEVIGGNPRILKSGRHDAVHYARLWQTIREGRTWSGRVVNRRKNGSLYTEEMTITPVIDDAGTITSFIAVKHDITDRLAEERSRTLLASIVNSAQEAIVACTLDGEILSWNGSAQRLFGYSSTEIVGRSADVLSPDAINPFASDIGTLRNGGTPPVSRRVCVDRHGRLVDVSVSASPVVDDAGAVVAMSVAIRDISEDVRAERALREIEERYQLLFDSASDMIGGVDAAGRLQFVNPAWTRVLGWDAHESIGRSIFDFADPVHRERYEDLMRRLESWSESIELAVTFIAKSGASVETEGRLSCVSDGERIVGLRGIFRDVTQRNRLEGATRAAERRFRALAETITDVFWMTSLDLQEIVYVSPAYERIWGRSVERLYADPSEWIAAVLPEDRDRVAAALASLGDTTPDVDVEFRIQRPDSAVRWIHVRGFLLRDADGCATNKIGVATDVTDRKVALMELEAAKAAAEAASRSKGEFLANMSHEIRTPMNGVLGLTGLALQTDLTEEQRDYLDAARSSAELLLGIINDILDFSKIEAGKLDVETAEFELRQAVEKVVRVLGISAAAKGIELTCDIEPNVPAVAVGDSVRLSQVLTNLISNAIKFTTDGDVAVRVGVMAAGPSDSVLQFSVRDTGIGIAKDKQALIFQSFVQADGSTTRKFGGTGLGLTIAARLTELMGGRIWVESEPGRGSTFHFTARLGVADSTGTAATIDRRTLPANLRVLVVDDNDTNRTILERTLVRAGADVTPVSSGALALEALTAALGAAPYAVAILDGQMPGLDGFMVAERVKADSRFAGLSLTLLTSGARPGDAQRGRDLGVDVLTKPVLGEDLIAAVKRAVFPDGRRERGNPVTLLGVRPSGQLSILLAEDNAVNRLVATRLLEKEGHRVVVATTGQDALDVLADRDVDCVLMDVHMPGMDGLEATRAIRRREEGSGRHLPIIAMTADAMTGDRERCLETGMDDYVSKPINPEEMFASIARLTQR